MRLTIIQYAGDYREAYHRLENGGEETYHAQRYSLNVVGSLAQRLEQVSVVCAITEEQYDTVLGNRVRAIGAGLSHGFKGSDLVRQIEKSKPTHLSLTTPNLSVLRWINANKIPSIAPLADSFQSRGVRSFVRNKLLAHYFNAPVIEWVGNHGINACLSLARIGVSPQKIVPWDWPHTRQPGDHAPKALGTASPRQLLFVGSVVAAKGVPDLLKAFALLRKRGADVSLSIVGYDPDEAMKRMAEALGILDATTFVGMVGHKYVPELMRGADVIIVPSRHEYPEGLPLTIYEALSARTPIVASDHPMFWNVLIDRESALVFPAGNAEKLADAIERLLSDPALYARISQNTEQAWKDIQLPVKMGSLLESWLSNDANRQDWIKAHALKSGRYG